MKILFIRYFALLCVVASLSGCARDLSHTTYTSDSTLNVVLSGQLISSRQVKIKESDKIEAGGGTLIGGLGGAAVGSAASNGGAAATLGGAVVGAVVGTVAQQALGTSTGMEYIIKVDTSKMGTEYYEGSALMRNSLAAVKASGIVTVVQAKESKKDPVLAMGQHVLVIISDKRTRVIADPSK